MSSTPWFRFYNEAINDPKLKRIATITKQPKALINGVWCGLLCLASESPDRGKLLISDDMPYLMEEIIEAVGIDYELGELIIDYLIKLEMVSLADNVYSITKWDDRQFKSDSSAERVRAYRERKAKQNNSSSNLDGNNNNHYPKRYGNSVGNVTVTAQDTESDTDTDKDKIRENHAPAPDDERKRECRNAMLSICYGIDTVAKSTDYQQKQIVEAFADLDRLFQPLPDEFKAFSVWWWGDTLPNPKQVLNEWSKFKNQPKRKERNYASNNPGIVGLQDQPKAPKPQRQVYDPATGQTYAQ